MPANDATSAKKFVKDWMDHRKVFDIEIDPTPGNLYFQFTGKSEGGIGFTVMQPKIWDTSVLVMAEVKIGEQHSKILESMRQKDREEFIFNLKKNIIFAPASYALDPTLETKGYPQGIQFSKEICYDNLTEDRLSNSMRDVVSCVIYILELFKNELGEAGV
ncbi:MAG: hypothetical protein QG588_1674 [Candidatus Poribacteria bacterium]|nr:hypothetical protein [Candidatus Poribacteria bacterium]